MNRVQLTGRLTADPELKTTPQGKSVTTFRLAVRRRFKKDESDFINVVAWEKTAEFVAEYITKGRLVAVAGTLQVNDWTDKEGVRQTRYQIVADEVEGLDKKKEGGDETPAPAKENKEKKKAPETEGTGEDYNPWADDE
jgi:single-strand DNA-binding protein